MKIKLVFLFPRLPWLRLERHLTRVCGIWNRFYL